MNDTFKKTKKEFYKIIEEKIANISKEDLIQKSKNIILNISKNIDTNFNGYYDKINVNRKYLNNEIKPRELRKEIHRLMFEAKREKDPLKERVIWATLYALSTCKNKKNFIFSILFMLDACKLSKNDEEIRTIVDAIKI